MENVYKIGRINIKISGDDPVIYSLQQELKPNKIENPKKIDIEFIFCKHLDALKNYTFYSPIFVNQFSYQAKHSGFQYQVSEKDEKIIVKIKPNKLNIKSRLKPKLLDWNYLSTTEKLAKNFMYDIFDYLTQICNLRKKQSYIHASSFEKNGKGIAIVAWGGIGKTTSLLKFIIEDGWRFLSDDLSIIDEDGILYRSPKKMQIYAYNLIDQPLIQKKLFSSRTFMDLIAWHLYYLKRGPKGVRRRISAEELFGFDSVSSCAQLTNLFFIERTSSKNFSTHSITNIELARRASNTILKEMSPFCDIVQAMYSSEYSPILPAESLLFENTFKILSSAFSKVNPLLIKIPLDAGPNELANFLRKYINN